jgi:Domain of unknown function (DUF4328)
VTQAVGVYGDYVSMHARARLLGGLLGAAALASWIAVGFDLADLRLLARDLAGEEIGAGQEAAYQIVGQAIFVFQYLLLALAGIAFIEWLYQSRINLRAFGVRRLRFPRGWALAAFLVPILNLVRPYQVVREVWKASDPRTRDPFAWTGVPTGWLLPLWWGAFVAWVLLALLGGGMALGAGPDPERLRLARAVATLADLAAAGGLSLGYFVVAHVSAAQERKWSQTRPG